MRPKINILYADDDAIAVELLKRQVGTDDFCVRIASDGRLTNIKHYCSVYQWITIKFATTSNREVTATNFYRYIAANG